MDELEVSRAKILRGQIILKLYNTYGEDISLNVLKGMLRYTGECRENDIKKAMYYLGGDNKRYIKLKLNEENYMDSKVWLTPTGVNLAEGDAEDIGVEGADLNE